MCTNNQKYTNSLKYLVVWCILDNADFDAIVACSSVEGWNDGKRGNDEGFLGKFLPTKIQAWCTF